ncbi:SDR family oxidoreductase [Nocardioides panacis]|uniref:SDR family oxidoreductase n=1 Tax=Nocardioides panacis TaxID=2849501 RepID=A0A975Y1Z4_9ACTN|nr:SDR family oxidoreductase [Nocardioides panacis]QWZ10026.1 SDR family oxidoreductase [Nocardioides panacis]
MPVAVITGASRGLGAALAHALDRRGWDLVVDARDADALTTAIGSSSARAVPGDVVDPAHRRALADTAGALGGADLLVNNASTLGASPMPSLAELTPEVLSDTLLTNVVAPHALTRLLLPQLLAQRGTVLNITSDAAVEPYEGWGAYGASKAALDQLTRILAAEQPDLRVYAVDPGDMRTSMHQDAFPGEDISDRPEPATVVPHLLALVEGTLPSGRYRAADVAVEVTS